MISERLKELREKRNMSQGELSAFLEISQQKLSLMEVGKRKPNLEDLGKMADLFDVTTDYLLGRAEDPHGVVIEGQDLPSALSEAGVSLVEVLEYKLKDGKLQPAEIAKLLELAAEYMRNEQ